MSREGWAQGIRGGYLVTISRGVVYDTASTVHVQVLFAARETYLCCDKCRLGDLVVTLLLGSVFVDVDVGVGTVARLRGRRVAQTRSPPRRHRKQLNAMRTHGR
jgi:hypothetical protein